ncbi:MAG: hypothetical protein Q8P98_04085 [Candidatus Rokubacteria bacterium]|jgi:hypothetical protein|nr:hypothetical protein [Candidatus Rokubacteria bacterium]
MPAKSEHEYRGWKVRITGNTVGTGSSAMIEVWEPGHDPHTDAGVVVPFHKRVPSEPEAQAVALQAAKKWIDREVRR